MFASSFPRTSRWNQPARLRRVSPHGTAPPQGPIDVDLDESQPRVVGGTQRWCRPEGRLRNTEGVRPRTYLPNRMLYLEGGGGGAGCFGRFFSKHGFVSPEPTPSSPLPPTAWSPGPSPLASRSWSPCRIWWSRRNSRLHPATTPGGRGSGPGSHCAHCGRSSDRERWDRLVSPASQMV